MSLRWKLVLALVCLTATASTAVGLLSYRSTAARLNSEVDRSLESAVGDAVSAVAGINGPRRRPPPSSRLQGISLQYLGPDGSVLDRDGSAEVPATGTDRELAEAARRGEEVFRNDRINGDEVRVLTVALGGGRGAVQGARSIDETNRVLASLRTRILLLTLAVAAVAGLVGVVIGESITRRLLRLTGVAERVAVAGGSASLRPSRSEIPQHGTDEVARLGRAFSEMLGALSLSEAEQARLVQDAGHELRTPMTSLRTNVFSLRSFADLDETSRRAVIEDLEGETEELSRLIDEVLEIASGGTALQDRAEVDLAGLVRSEAQRTGRRWNRSVSVSADPDGDGAPIVVQADARQLARAVRNLVDNAAKFSPQGSPIDVVVSRTEGPAGSAVGARVEVLDRGPGFEPGDLEDVFRRFHRSEAARALPGSGLGLSMVASVAASHGGVARASNRPDGGASVELRIPLVASGSVEAT